ncbi:hypothetical protein BDW74DRAFT_179149 [Aspergillus multicolor]|uniref:uncharacterized protein n=1 Tax=Aspergillus multicolor TaxID=41759 RepID=UPI003CCE28B2
MVAVPSFQPVLLDTIIKILPYYDPTTTIPTPTSKMSTITNFTQITSFEVSASIIQNDPFNPYPSLILTFSPPAPTTKSIAIKFERAVIPDSALGSPSPGLPLNPTASPYYRITAQRDTHDINAFPNRILLDRVAARDIDFLTHQAALGEPEPSSRPPFMMYTLQETGGSIRDAYKTIWREDIQGILLHLLGRGILTRRPEEEEQTPEAEEMEIRLLAGTLKHVFEHELEEGEAPRVELGPWEVAPTLPGDFGKGEITGMHRGVKRGREE